MADMWIHESFTCYSENLFVEYYYGKKASHDYVRGLRNGIDNDRPLIGTYNVNSEGSSDMYSKGANMIHTLRQIVNNDEKWSTILRGLNSKFYHQTVTTKQIEEYLIQTVDVNLSSFFNQYLRDTRIPTLEYKFKNSTLSYRWTNCVSNFTIPLKVTLNGKEKWLKPKTEWSVYSIKSKDLNLVVNPDFYVNVLKGLK
jgi:aminopeptidase N